MSIYSNVTEEDLDNLRKLAEFISMYIKVYIKLYVFMFYK